MKRVRIIMAMLVLLGAASMAEAQIVVSQTTASTTRVHEKSGREKGLVIRPEISGGLYWDAQTFMVDGHINLCGTAEYQINPFFSIGGGLGIRSLIFRNTSLSAFANARYYFCDRAWSPFLNLQIGYNQPVKTIEYDGYMHWYMKGFMMNVEGGIQYRNFDFGCAFGLYNDYNNFDYWDFSYDYHNQLKFIASLNVAYNIQFKKK